ncbi:AsmA-like C-terminal region-containing protein [Aureimonas mangrovi]|uniref:AsmA-like C-terminal region-containing protein n=1 Tax=Aureimonas mangrovi TaxID=2758041 RepID=UPI00163DB084|nr:AsmA-like C-terminal region-containing protein [Aureimonas mangrovi]
MRLAGRLLVAALSLALVLVILALGAVAFVVFTEPGNRFARERTQATIARLLGPSYVGDLGEQSFEMRGDGTLAIGWEGVTLSRADGTEPPTRIDRIGVAVRLMPLLGGGLEFGRLEIEGAEIDLGAFLSGQSAEPPQEGRSVSQMADGAVVALERQLSTLNALRFDALAFRDIAIEGLPGPLGEGRPGHVQFAELRRDGGGTLDLSAAVTLGRLPLALDGRAEFDEDARLDAISLRSGPVDLGLVVPPGPADDPRDDRPFATDADLALTMSVSRSSETDKLSSELTMTVGPGAVQAGRNHTRVEEIALRLRHEEGADRIEVAPSRMRFADVSFGLTGQVEAVAGEDGEELRFEAAARDLASRIGLPEEADEPIRADVSVAGVVNLSAGRFELSSLDLRSGENRLAGTGVLDLSAPQARSSLTIEGTTLDAPTVKALWPFNIAGRARGWVVDNLGDEGRVPQASIRLDVARERFGRAFGPGGEARPREIAVDVAVEGADLSTLGELPRLYNTNGNVRLRGTRTVITAQDAMIEGHDAAALGTSTLTFTKPRDGNRRDALLDIAIDVSGGAGDLLRIADAHPIRALRALDFTPQDATGTGHAKADVSLRLSQDLEPADQLQDWSVIAELMDASVTKPIEGRRFEHLSGEVAVDPGAARANLTGMMDAIPATIAASFPVGQSPTVERAVDIDLDISASKATEIVPALAGSLEGSIAGELRQDASGLRATLDLTRTGLSIPAIAWRKGPGIAGKLDLSIEQNGEEMRLGDMRLTGDGFSASGSAVVDGRGLSSARLGDIALNPGDAVSLAMQRSSNGFSVSVEGTQFDARPLLQQLRNDAGRSREPNRSGQTFDIEARIDRVRGFDERVMEGVSVNYASYEGRVAALSLTGRIGAGVVRADLSPRGERQAIRIASEDLGAFVGFAGVYGNMDGGAGSLDLSGTAEGRYVGRLQLANFTIVDEPRLERFVGSSPAPGQQSLSQAVGKDLRTSRAFFDQASAELLYADGRLAARNGIIRGPIFGSSFEGTLYDSQSRIDIAGSFMPAYTVNRIFGALPLVGQILGNGNEGGLLGITYQLSGNFASPTLTVNPISLVAPGVFRQIFEY